MDFNLRTKIGMLAAGAAAVTIALAAALPSAAESDVITPPSATTAEPTVSPEPEPASTSAGESDPLPEPSSTPTPLPTSDPTATPLPTSDPTPAPHPTSPVAERNAHGSGW